MNALRGGDITAEELATAVAHDNSTTDGNESASDDAPIKGEPATENSDSIAFSGGPDSTRNERSYPRVLADEASHLFPEAKLINGMLAREAIAKLRDLLPAERSNMLEAKTQHVQLQVEAQKAVETQHIAEAAREKAETAQERTESAFQATRKSLQIAEKRLTEAEQTAAAANKEKDRIAKRLKTLSNEHTILVAEKGNKNLIAKAEAEIKQKSEKIEQLQNEVENLNKKLVEKASKSMADEDTAATLKKQNQKHEAALSKKDALLEKHQTALQKNAQEIRKLEKRLAEANRSPSKQVNDNDATPAEQKKAIKKQRKELEEARELFEAEKQEKRDLKKKHNVLKEEVVRFKILLEQEKKSRKSAEKKLAHELEAKGKLKERLAKARGDDADDDDDSSTAYSDDEGSDSDDGEGADHSDGNEDTHDHKQRGPKRVSIQNDAVKVKTENRRSRSTSSQKGMHKVKKAGTKVRARNGREGKN